MDFSDEQTRFLLLSNLPTLIFIFWMFHRVIRKAGRSGWWVFVIAVPLLNLVMFWVFSFVRWPGLEHAKAERTMEIFS